MESTGGTSGSTITAAASMPSPSVVADNCKVFCSSLFTASNFEFHPSISEEEKKFYIKAYPTVDVVRERKTHCTVCKIHIGTAPVQENGIKMHPILRVTHCNKCHDFYNSGEFSKGEDGSELYCRWCGQGGEVYCCSSCPYVFCKSCIVKNLSRGVVADIEQNENWNCFNCAPKILWPLRAQHWALMNYIEQQKKELYALNLSEAELKMNLSKDTSRCCRLAKAKCGNMSDSLESLDSVSSKRSHSSSYSNKKLIKHSTTSPQLMSAAKRAKSNDEVVCTPDLLSMLEPDCQITVPLKPNRPLGTPSASTPKIMSIQQPQNVYTAIKSSAPPPLVLRNTAIKIRAAAPPPVVRRTIIGPRTPNPGGNGTPVYHTINGYRIDLNSAAQQETFRLPNGKLIQVKRQGPPAPQNISPSTNNWQQMTSPQQQRIIPQTIASRPVQITPHPYNINVQQQQAQHPQVVRYNNMIGATTINPVTHNGTTIQVLNGQMSSVPQSPSQQQPIQQSGPIRPVMVRHVFPDTPIGHARSGLQDQVFNAMDICTHLTNKVQTLTNSNAYKQARNYLEVKELYIHLSYLLTYAIGRFKSLQDKCLGDMRNLGFGNDADCLENGQLAADKQASDDEDNEIEIVEPKTDLITLDSDDEEPATSTPIKSQHPLAQSKSQPAYSSPQHGVDVKNNLDISPVPIIQTKNTGLSAIASTPPLITTPQPDENLDLMSMAQSFLASMLEVEIQEGSLNSPGSDSSGQKKQPRKKLTNKPNPTLLKQKALMERERLDELKRNDQKLKMKCTVELKKAEEVFPFAKEMVEARVKGNLERDEVEKKEEDEGVTYSGGESESEVAIEDEAMNISFTTEENNENEDNEKNKSAIEEKKITEITLKMTEGNAEISEIEMSEKETPMEDSKKETSFEIIVEMADKSAESIAKIEKNKLEDDENEKTEKELNNTEMPDKSAESIAQIEKDKSEDRHSEKTEKELINTEMPDISAESIAQIEKDKSEDGHSEKTEKDLNNTEMPDKSAESIAKIEKDKSEDDESEKTEKQLNNTPEVVVIRTDYENINNNDIEEINTNNGLPPSEDNLSTEMETDKSQPPAAAAKDESMEIDDEESSRAAIVATHDLNNVNETALNEIEPEEDEQMEKALQTQEENSEDVSIKEIIHFEQQQQDNVDENVSKSVKDINEHELTSPIEEILPTPTATDTTREENNKDEVQDFPMCEEEITGKLLPSLVDDIPSKDQMTETPSTELKETEITASSNGNV